MSSKDELQSQYDVLIGIQKELENAIGTLVLDLKEELDVRAGKPPTFSDVPGMESLCIGLKWSLLSEPWNATDAATRLIDMMNDMRTDAVDSTSQNGLSLVPQKDLDEFLGLQKEFLDLRDQWISVRKKMSACWDEKIRPYLATS